MTTSSTLRLPDGALLTYEVLNLQKIDKEIPIVLIGGMSNVRGDWNRLAATLSNERTVLLYDHRGIGDSKFASENGDTITTDSLARDLHCLLTHLQWKTVAVLGYSMGGVVAQQLCLLPHHPTNPATLNYRVSHLILASTTPSPEVFRSGKYGLVYPPAPKKVLSLKERKELIRIVNEKCFDSAWLNDPKNAKRFDEILTHKATTFRPLRTIKKQSRAMISFNLGDLHAKFAPPPTGPAVLVIHGTKDAIVPFFAGEQFLNLIPHAKMIEVGPGPGQLENLDFGHTWDEYFELDRWSTILGNFLSQKYEGENRSAIKARL